MKRRRTVLMICVRNAVDHNQLLMLTAKCIEKLKYLSETFISERKMAILYLTDVVNVLFLSQTNKKTAIMVMISVSVVV
jgi:hypothetical protein